MSTTQPLNGLVVLFDHVGLGGVADSDRHAAFCPAAAVPWGELPAEAASVRLARQWADERLDEALNATQAAVLTRDAVALVVSELVTNAVAATLPSEGDPVVRLMTEVGHLGVAVQVSDNNPATLPYVTPNRDELAVCGRGLMIVESVAAYADVTRAADHKTVRVLVPAPFAGRKPAWLPPGWHRFMD